MDYLGQITDIEKDICMSCGRKYPHRIVYWKDEAIQFEEGIKEVRMILNCCGCRTIFDKIKKCDEVIEKLKQDKLNYEFSMFSKIFNKNN